MRQIDRFHLRAAIELGCTPFVFDFDGAGSPLDAKRPQPLSLSTVVLALRSALPVEAAHQAVSLRCRKTYTVLPEWE